MSHHAGYPSNPNVLFWDHKCLFQKKMRPEYDPRKGHRFGDYLIRNRTLAEHRDFSRSLEGMHALYFHQKTIGIVIPDVPPGALNTMPYWRRGWPLMERTALGLSGTSMTVHLAGLGQLAGRAWCAPMSPPLSLEDFGAELAKREFMGAGDHNLVMKIYQEGLQEFQQKAVDIVIKTSDFEEARFTARALGEFVQLRTVHVNWETQEFLGVGEMGRRFPSQCPELKIVLERLEASGVELKEFYDE